jgi:hypothetical protein
MAGDDSMAAGDLTSAASTEASHRTFLFCAAVDLAAVTRPAIPGQPIPTVEAVQRAVASPVATPVEAQKRPAGTTAPIPRFTGPSPPCPRCHADGSYTKFCYYNNHNVAQPRFFCKVLPLSVCPSMFAEVIVVRSAHRPFQKDCCVAICISLSW